MKKVVTIIYAILSLIFFSALFLFSGLKLFQVYQTNAGEGRTQLSSLKAGCVLWQQGLWDDRAFDLAVKDLFATNDRLLALSVYSPTRGIQYGSSRAAADGTAYLLRPVSAVRRSSTLVWQGRPQYQGRPFLGTWPLDLKVMTDPGNDLQLEGLYHLLRYPELFSVLKTGFIALLVWLGASIILRIWLSTRPSLRVVTPGPAAGLGLGTGAQEELTGHPRQGSGDIDDLDFDLERAPGVYPSSAAYTGPGPQVDVSPRESAATSMDSAFYQQVERKSVRELFSPRTGMGWEEHLLPRLKTEIKRTASFDQDMSLTLINLDNPAQLREAEAVVQGIARLVLELFPFQDLAFEQGRYGFAVILPDLEVRRAIKEMEILQRKIGSRQIQGQFVTVSIGLSSRNGRLVSAPALLKEASRALEKAIAAGGGRIIAFNPDPDKYREVVSRQV